MSGSEQRVLVLNCGSSSVRAAILQVGRSRVERTATATISRLGPDAVMRIARGHAAAVESPSAGNHEAALHAVLDALSIDDAPVSVGHRIVHGGPDRAGPARVDTALIAELRRLVPLAPLHQEAGLRGIELAAELLPGIPQIACFDTAFHRSMPPEAQRLPLPAALFDEGVRRYGFHGLSCQHVVESLGAERLGRAIIAHLGAGASLTAVRAGRSVDTTMGFTPTGGMIMATRSGDLDPSILIHLIDRHGYDARRLEQLVEHESGLAGVSGTSGDMQALLAHRADDPAAALAVELFCRDARKHVGALATVLGGLDTLVFTGGIGEHAAIVRGSICASLEHLGIELDDARNARAEAVISSDSSACAVRVVPTDEEAVIARQTAQVALAELS